MSGNFSQIPLKPAYTYVFEAIESAILLGEFEEGSHLPTEAELCEQFGVKRSTVREGIRLLEQTGLVRRVNAKRLAVSRPATDEAAERTNAGLERHGVTFGEVLEAICAIQPATARLAAQRAGPDDLIDLRQNTKNLEASTTAAEVIEFGIGYLFLIGMISQNRVMEVTLRSLNLFAKTMLEQVIDKLPDAQTRIASAQGHITAAIAEADSEGAEAWMLRHVDDLRRGYELAGIDLASSMSVLSRSIG